MWLLKGRFSEDSRQELSKVLKYGQTYTLGRKIPADIVIDSKFVSRTSCHLTIASEETVASRTATATDPSAFHKDLSLRPRVTIRFEANKSRKTFGVTQQSSTDPSTSSGPTQVQVPADQDHVLHDGDSFALTTTISLRLVWKPIAVCFAARVKETSISPLRKAALQLGIHLSPAKSRWRDGYTHLCLVQVKPTESVLCALVQACPIVSIDYFQELFRRAELPRHDPQSLETSFEELDLAAYQPAVDQQELSDLPDLPQKLLPNDRRTYMLKGTTCLFFALPSEDAEMTIYKSILALAGAHVFTHNPEAEKLQTKADFAQLLMPYKNRALSYWRNSGSNARSEAPDEGLVVLVSAVHDHTPWKDACTIACTNLRIAMPTGFHAVTNAVFSADARAHLNIIPNMSDGQVDSAVISDPPAARVVSVSPAPQHNTGADVATAEPVTSDPSSPPAATAHDEVGEASADVPAESQPPVAPAEIPSTAGESHRRPLTRRTRKLAPSNDDAASESIPGAEQADPVDFEAHSRANSASARSSADPSSSQLTRAERSSLTRRTGANRANARRSDLFDAILQTQAASTMDEGVGSGSVSGDVDRLNRGNAAAGSSIPKSRRYRMDLDEEDRIQDESMAQTQGTEAHNAVSQRNEPAEGAERNSHKRKSPPQMQGTDGDDREARSLDRASKRTRPVEAGDEQQSAAASASQAATEPVRIVGDEAANAASGLSEGRPPDTEPQFLQALNTQRAKGRKMDEFDAEFNRLQIVKPGTQSTSGTLDRFTGSRSGRATQQQGPTQASAGAGNIQIDEDYEAFKQMAEEELRIHVRGNFVQVDFVPLVRQKKSTDDAAQLQRASSRAGGDVPNFKKFRPKANANVSAKSVASPATAPNPDRHRVQLMLPESNDYGLGQSYWEEQDGRSSLTSGTGATRGGRSARVTARAEDRSDVESEPSELPHRTRTGRGRVALDPASVEATAVDLDLDGLDSMESEDEADMTTMLERRHGPRSQRADANGTATAAPTGPARGRKRPAALVEASDEEMDSPSTASMATAASQKKRVPTRAATMIIDDDESDDGSGDDGDNGNFAGFGRSSSTRLRRDAPASGMSRARRSRF